MKVELASCGNPDQLQDPDHPMYGCESDHYVTVKTLEEASSVSRAFIERNFLGGGNWIGGKVFEKNKCIALIAYTGKIMPPKPVHASINDEQTMTEKVLVAVGIGDVPAWLADDGLELAKTYFEDNSINPYACFKAILYGSNTELESHWDKAEEVANRVLLSNSQYDNSMISLTFTENDI